MSRVGGDRSLRALSCPSINEHEFRLFLTECTRLNKKSKASGVAPAATMSIRHSQGRQILRPDPCLDLASEPGQLVSRFRSSHHCAAHSFANFGIKGTLAIYDSSAGFGFEVPTQTRGYNDRNFKSTALVIWNASSLHYKSARERRRRALMANAGMRGRSVVRLVLSAQERSYLERQVRRHRVADRCLSGAASFCDARTVCRARMWRLNSACANTPLASGAADFEGSLRWLLDELAGRPRTIDDDQLLP